MEWNCIRCAIMAFEVGDRIGGVEGLSWKGEIVVSEQCSMPEPTAEQVMRNEGEPWWHLGWIEDDAPGKVFHFRGPARSRDLRWWFEVTYIISEQP